MELSMPPIGKTVTLPLIYIYISSFKQTTIFILVKLAAFKIAILPNARGTSWYEMMDIASEKSPR